MFHPRTLLLALLLAPAACVAPPPPIVLHPQPLPRTRQATVRPIPRCDPATPRHSPLTEAEKSRLFADFDGWQDGHRPPGTPAETTPPPAAPRPSRATSAPCRPGPS